MIGLLNPSEHTNRPEQRPMPSEEFQHMLEQLDIKLHGEAAINEDYRNCIGDCSYEEGRKVYSTELKRDDDGNVIYECPDCGGPLA